MIQKGDIVKMLVGNLVYGAGRIGDRVRVIRVLNEPGVPNANGAVFDTGKYRVSSKLEGCPGRNRTTYVYGAEVEKVE